MRGSNRHRVYTELYTVEGQEEHILRTLAENTHLRFEELFQGMTVKMEVVVTFIAMLDLLKSGQVRANQSKMYGEIWLEALEVDQESPDSNTTPDGQDPAEDQDD
jgi:segregation and condensation protein A